MLKKRIIITLTFLDGILYRTKKFIPDYRYTKNFVDLWNADEIILLDVSAKEKKLNHDFKKNIQFFIDNCHVPLSVGGGIDSLEKAQEIFDLGVEKIILNSLTYYDINLTNKISEIYGSSSIIHSFDCKKNSNQYEVYVDNGNTKVEKKFIEYFQFISQLNIGEILINNIDNDGSLMGYDLNLIKILSEKTKLPIIVQGGAGTWEHFYEVFLLENVYGACTQNIYHFTEASLLSLKKFLFNKKVAVRYDF